MLKGNYALSAPRRGFLPAFATALIWLALVCAAHGSPTPAAQLVSVIDKPCTPPTNSTTLAAARSGLIYGFGQADEGSFPRVYGCLYQAERPRRLRLPALANGHPILRWIHIAALEGPWAAYSWSAVRGVDQIVSGVAVENLITGKLSHANYAASVPYGRGLGWAETILVKHNGSVAWAADTGLYPPRLQVELDGIEGFRVVAEGPEVDADSLALEASSLTWVEAGMQRSATLR